MAISSLSSQYISSSFDNITQVSALGELYDGLGNKITNLTASYINPTFISASVAASGLIPVPGGLNTYIQYNKNGTFEGTSKITFNGTTLNVSGSFSGSLTGPASQIPIAPPSFPPFTSGSIYFDCITNTLNIWNGSSWYSIT